MTLNTTVAVYKYGLDNSTYSYNTYCVNDKSKSDYGKCYNIISGTAFFIQTDTTTYPSGTFPCEKDGTCTRYTTTTTNRTLSTICSYSGKQCILQSFWSRSHSSSPPFNYNIQTFTPFFIRPDTGIFYTWFLPSPNYELSSWPIYEPVYNFKAYYNPYTITYGYVAILRWSGTLFTTTLYLFVYEANLDNAWYAGDVRVVWAYESSPLAIIPLDYDKDYAPYQELRNAFGYAITGVDQPGWNADDIVRVLKEIYPDRAWAVYDDKTYTLYLYNLTPDYVPDWLINRLTPVAIKVLQPSSDSSVAKAWLDSLNARNAYNQPPTGTV